MLHEVVDLRGHCCGHAHGAGQLSSTCQFLLLLGRPLVLCWDDVDLFQHQLFGGNESSKTLGSVAAQENQMLLITPPRVDGMRALL